MAGDPYQELGVARGASDAEIKAAFRKLAKELHPDKNRGNPVAEERFKKVSAAFDLLSDPKKKARYDAGQIDAEGQEQYRGFSGAGGPGAGPGGFGFSHAGGPGGRAAFDDIDLESIFGNFGQRGPQRAFGKGQDVRATLEISLEDSIGGASRRIQFSDGRTLDVNIPKGASNGQTIRLRGQGMPGRTEAGDALIELRVAPHPIFKVEGADVVMDLPVSVPDAVLGGKVECPTPDGTVAVTVPKGSNSGQVLRLKGKGAYAGGARGDLKARIMVTLPDRVDPILERIAEDWRNTRPYKPGRGVMDKPSVKPKRPWFSAGPTAKRPGWSSQGLPHDLLGRGIRAPEVVERFAHALRLTKTLLEVPQDWVLAYVPGSDTGAVEAAMWNMLGARPTQVMAFENFGKLWAVDAKDHLKLPDLELLEAPWGQLPDLGRVDPAKDLVFPWNGTTAGVRVPNADFIAKDREGIVICDATSAAFAMPIDYERVDVVTFSFQKALGGEAGIGIAALGPRAVARLDAYEPPRAVPKVLRLRDAKGFDRALATGTMINTFSLWTLEDWIDALEWARAVGGLKELIRRTDANAGALFDWVERTDWIEPLAVDPATRSTTSVCLKIVDPRVTALDEARRQAFVKRMKTLLEAEGAAYDVESHRNAPAGLRLWCGCTVETEDVEAATPWLEWAFRTAVSEL